MRKLLAIMFILCLSVALDLAVKFYGWGMEPKNWWWIVGGSVIGFTVIRAMFDATMKEDK